MKKVDKTDKRKLNPLLQLPREEKEHLYHEIQAMNQQEG